MALVVMLLVLLFLNIITGQYVAFPQRYYGYHNRQRSRGLTLVQTLDYKGHRTFLSYVRKANLQHVIGSLGPYTVFAPTDDAFRSMPADLATKIDQDSGALWQFVTSHIVNGLIPNKSFRDGEILTGLIGQQLYLNTITDASQGNETKTWIQGSLLVRTIGTSNGIIHAIQEVVITPDKDLRVFLQKSLDHTIIRKVLKKSGLQMSAKMTFLAPYDSAFKDLPKEFIKYILKNKDIQTKLILHHTIPNPMCQDRLLQRKGNYNLISALGLPLRIYRDPFSKDRLYMDNSEMITSAPIYEGWVKSVTGILLPYNRKSVYKLAKSLGASEFGRMIDRAGLAPWLSTLYQTFTLFVPREEAFQTLDQEIWYRIQSEPTFLQDIIKYHILQKRILSENVKKFGHLTTELKINGTKRHRAVKVNKYYGKFVVQGAVVVQQDNLAANGIVHLIDKVLVPPSKTLYELLRQDATLNIFTQALYRSGFIRHLKGRRSLTVFAPDNAAFLAMIAKRKYSLTGSRREFKKLINKHVFPEAFFASSMIQHTTYILKTLLENDRIRLILNGDEAKDLEILDYGAFGIKTDIPAINGVLHIINKVLL